MYDRLQHPPGPEPHRESETRAHARQLLEFTAYAQPVSSDLGQACVSIPLPKGDRVFPIRSASFRDWLVAAFYNQYGILPNARALNYAIRAFQALAFSNPSCTSASCRVAEHPGSPQIALDLAADTGEFVEITDTRWDVSHNPAYGFRRIRGALPLPAPVPCDDPPACLNTLRRLLNLPGDRDWLRALAWLLAAFRPPGPFPVLIMNGPSGSGKSTAARLLRSLIDPCTAPLYPLPSSERQLLLNARSAWVLAFDHVISVTRPISAALSRLATGDGFLRPERFEPPGVENRDPLRPSFRRPILLAALREHSPFWAPPADLAGRSLMVDLPPILPKDRRPEFEINREFEQVQPRLLGLLCTAVSAALGRFGEVRLENPPLFADAAVWAVAAAPALGISEDAMRLALEPDVPLPADPVAHAVIHLLRGRAEWQGTATELHDLLRPCRDGSWPRTPKGLSQRLASAALSLQTAGIDLQFSRGNQGRRIRMTHRPVRCVMPVDN